MKHLTTPFLISLALLLLSATLHPATTTWVGGHAGATTSWNTKQNWSSNTVPSSFDTVLFDNTSSFDCTLDANAFCSALKMTTYGNALTIATGFQLLVDTYLKQSGAGSTITFQTNGTLNVHQYIAVTGGSFNTTTGTIIFNGAGSQTWSGVTSFSNLSVFGGGTLHLPASTVNGTLTLGSAFIAMDSDPLTVATISGGDASSYVKGAVAHAFGSVPFTFPIGDNGYAPATVSTVTGTGTISVKTTYANPVHDVVDAGNVLKRTWNITLGAVTDASITLTYPAADAPGTEASYQPGAFFGGVWSVVGGDYDAPGHNFTILDGFSPLEITAGTPAALPIVLSSFTGSAGSASGVALEWSTTSETNTYGFYAERRQAGTSFSAISGLIAGAGTTLERHDYSFTDITPTPGTYYYRIREVDLDGAITYSGEIEIVVDGVLGVDESTAAHSYALGQNYPNPFNPKTDFKYQIAEFGMVTLKVFDVTGREVATLVNEEKAPGSYDVSFDASELASGVYIYMLTAGTFRDVKSMVLIR